MHKPLSLLVRSALVGLGLLIASFAHADTLLAERPGNEITAAQAFGLDKPYFECREVAVQHSRNPTKVAGTDTTFHTAIGEGVKNAREVLKSGKSLISCKKLLNDMKTTKARSLR